MKKIKMITLAMLIALTFLTPTVILSNVNTSIAYAASITLSSKSATLEISKTKKLTVSGTKSKVSWSSNNRSVATVSSSGTITAKAAGSATITASVSGKKLTCKVTVPPIKLSAASATLEIGEKATLKISGTTKTPTWSTSSKSIATVSSSGKITAVKTGTATITASVAGKKLSCKVTVITPVKLSASSLSMEIGDASTLKISGTTKTVTWSSSNKSIAAVSSKGKVTAVKDGTVTITASVSGKTKTCKVTVLKPVALNSTKLSLQAGTANQLTLSREAKTSLWTSSNTKVAAVSTNGLVTALSPGTTTITAYYDGKRLTCAVTVTQYVSTVTGSAITVKLGDNYSVSVAADGITDKVTYKTANQQVVSVSDTGLLRPISAGTTTVTASAADVILSSYIVTVVDPSHPYLKKAPFPAKAVTADKLSFVVPQGWYMEQEHYEDASIIYMDIDDYSLSNVLITTYNVDEAQSYKEAKLEFAGYMTEAVLRKQYDAVFKPYGIKYSISGFKQSDYQADFGKVFKTELTVKAEGESLKQIIYLFYIDKYMVNITVTDGGDKNFSKYCEYIMNSFTLK